MPQHPSPGKPHSWNDFDTAVYHITDVENLGSLLEKGALLCEEQCSRRGLSPVCIAYTNLKSTRSQIDVVAAAGGKLSDYVPFYFAPRSPMLYVNHVGGVDGYDKGQEEIVHLVCCAEELARTAPSLITDGHPASPLTSQFAGLASLADDIDWDVMHDTWWRDTDEDGDRKRRRQAEFLVHDHVSLAMVRQLGVHSEKVAAMAREALAPLPNPPPVAVRRDWYY